MLFLKPVYRLQRFRRCERVVRKAAGRIELVSRDHFWSEPLQREGRL